MTDLDRLRATLARLRARPDPSGWEERHRDDLATALAEIDRLAAAAESLRALRSVIGRTADLFDSLSVHPGIESDERQQYGNSGRALRVLLDGTE